MSHTEGKLQSNGDWIGDDAGDAICYVDDKEKDEENFANATRLVTCWNEHDDLIKERDELVALLHDLLSVVDVDPELAQYPASKATRELLAEKYPEAS